MDKQNKEKSYICPPKLNQEFLMGFWSVWELAVAVVFIVVGVLSLNAFLLACSATVFIGTARIQGDYSVFKKLWIRTKYFASIQVYKQK